VFGVCRRGVHRDGAAAVVCCGVGNCGEGPKSQLMFDIRRMQLSRFLHFRAFQGKAKMGF